MPTDPMDIKPVEEMEAADRDESKAEFDGSAEARATAWFDAAGHREEAARYYEWYKDFCQAAREFAAASDDYELSANAQLLANNVNKARRDRELAADTAAAAARMYEKCAAELEENGRRLGAHSRWVAAEIFWQRARLWAEERKRYWTAEQRKSKRDGAEESAHLAGVEEAVAEAARRTAEDGERRVHERAQAGVAVK